MAYANAVEPVTVFKSRSAEIIRRARESGQPILITQNGRATAVLQDVDTFERQRKALLLLKFLARGDADIREGRTVSHAKAVGRLARKLKDLQRA